MWSTRLGRASVLRWSGGEHSPAHPEPSRYVSGESEFNFLLVEVGVPGMVVLLWFMLTVIGRSLRGLRKESDPEIRLLVSALLAALIAILVLWFGGPVTAAPPLACYMWLSAGALAYWTAGGGEPGAISRTERGRLSAYSSTS